MGIDRPYRRTCRQFVDGRYREGGRWGYLLHPKFAESPEHYIRAFLLLQEDLKHLFQYVEPAESNLDCYSYRIHELLLRACVEVEANCKAILKENGYHRTGNWDIRDYRKIERSHRLSAYLVKLPLWNGGSNIRQPFAAWSDNRKPLPWYTAYNDTKHDRHVKFAQATFKHMIDAVSGLLVVLSAQFSTENFSPGPTLLAAEGSRDDLESAIGNYFRIRFPDDWPMDERYEFKWQEIEKEEDPFREFPFS